MATSGYASDTKNAQQPLWVEKELLSASEQQAFDALERQFNEVLYELQSDPALDKYRNEYERLHRALKKSHESEKRLIKKCRELNTEILTNTTKLKTALGHSEEDQLLMSTLKEEIEKAWKMVDTSQEKEATAKENIRALTREIESLSGIVDQSVQLTLSKDAKVVDLEEEKQTIMRERDRVLSTLAELKGELARWIEKVRVLEQDKLHFEDDLSEVKNELQAKKVDCERELRKKERLEKEMRELRVSLETYQMQLKQKEAALIYNQEYVTKLEVALHEQKSVADKATKMLDALHLKIAKLQGDLEAQIQSNTQLLSDNSSKMLELKGMEDELDCIRDEVFKVKKMREATMNKLKLTEQQREELEVQQEQLKSEISQLERDVETQHKLAESEKKRVEEFARERDVLTKMKAEADDTTLKHMDIMRIKEAVIHSLELEVQQYRDAATKQDNHIKQLEKERQRSGDEASTSARKYMKALDGLQEKEFQIIDLLKKMEDSQMQLKQQKAMFDIVRVEKNMYNKRLVETQDEINEVKRKLMISTHAIENLKEQLSLSDDRLEKGMHDIERVEKEKEALTNQLVEREQKIQEAQEKITQHLAQIENHDFVMGQMQIEKERLIKEFDAVKSERDLLATQLVRRTEELQLVYKKIRVQRSTLDKGRLQYLERLNELRILKLKLTDFKREHAILSTTLKDVPILKHEIYNVARELSREKLKVRVMTEELENPQNIHRWRLLESTDPSAYEMITKIQTLQRRLILKTEEVVDKDMLIQEKEKLYIEMQKILARQPGPEVAEKLNSYARTLLEKNGQLKAMSSELHMYQSQVKELKAEIQSLNEELHKSKLKYMDQIVGKATHNTPSSSQSSRPLSNPSPRSIKSALRVRR